LMTWKGPVSTETKSSFTVWTVGQLSEWEAPRNSAILSEDPEDAPLLSINSMAAVVGAGGVGKSRLVLNMAVAQITGKDFCGLTTHGPPRTWLFVGNENSKTRLKGDILAMQAELGPVERDLLQEHLLLHVQETIDDAILDNTTEAGVKRWKATLGEFRPDILVVDPFEALVPDTNDAQAVRKAMTGISQLVQSFNPAASVLFVHHARTGSMNTLQAVGYNSANFVKGSKTFFSICRFIMNVAQGDAEDRRKIVLACGKSNDSPHFETRGLVLNADHMTYRLDPSFDLESWKADVEGKRNPGRSVTVGDVVMSVGDGKHARKAIIEHLKEETGASARTIDTRISDAVKHGYIERTQPPGNYIRTDKGREFAKKHE
jgi:hypothetical protein